MTAPEIVTERLVLRAVQLSDAPDIFDYVKNPNVLRYTTGTPPTVLSETQAFVQSLVNQPPGSYAWSIRLQAQPEVIGVIEFSTTDGVTGAVDYALSEAYWNQGIMTEAVRAVLTWAFRTNPPLNAISSAAMTANPASTRVQEKCGMKMVGKEVRSWSKFAEPVEVAICRLSREEWGAN